MLSRALTTVLRRPSPVVLAATAAATSVVLHQTLSRPRFTSCASMAAFKVDEEELKKRLSPEQFKITRQKGTEYAFSGKYYKNKDTGVYHCVVCEQALFDSSTKFDSGTGWPSYHTAIPGAVIEESDRSYGMVRTEAMCSKCHSHLGHVFDDGPKPTGLRYCINSASLDFKKGDKL